MLELSDSARQTLLSIARAAIHAEIARKPLTHDEYEDVLHTRAGVFVSLHIGEELRGCIGTLQSTDPLYLATEHAARSAATRDPRFPPLSARELELVHLEISVLSPFELVRDFAEIVPGTHGLIVRRGLRSGLLLPQVATEYGWDREEFLSYTCRKAGLPQDAWRDGSCEIQKFTAVVFSEK
jgi:AmmeMemoRadiSam system protein A